MTDHPTRTPEAFPLEPANDVVGHLFHEGHVPVRKAVWWNVASRFWAYYIAAIMVVLIGWFLA